jgi:hypothetical protein
MQNKKNIFTSPQNYLSLIFIACILTLSVTLIASTSFADAPAKNPLTGETVIHNYGHSPTPMEESKVGKELAHATIESAFQAQFKAQVEHLRICIGR